MVSLLHCYGPWWAEYHGSRNRVEESRSPHGSQEAERDTEEKVKDKIHLSRVYPPVNYFLQKVPPLIFHYLPIMPLYYKSIKGLIH
jgi:hypothetical protein